MHAQVLIYLTDCHSFALVVSMAHTCSVIIGVASIMYFCSESDVVNVGSAGGEDCSVTVNFQSY